MTVAIYLAFLMSLITASSNIILKKGFFKIQPFFAVYISVAISTIFLWGATFLFIPRSAFINLKGILVFILVGSFAPTIVRTLTYYGIHKLGAARAAPLRAMTPFFATLMAIRFLQESPEPGIFLGTGLMVLGISFLSQKEKVDKFNWKPVYFLFSLGAAFLAGLAANLRKLGLNFMPEPILASAVTATSSMIILSFCFFSKHRSENSFLRLKDYKRELKFITVAAILTSCGEIVDLTALLYGKVSLVVPIFATTPLLIIILSKIFLKTQEKVTKRLVLASVLMISGVYISITNAISF